MSNNIPRRAFLGLGIGCLGLITIGCPVVPAVIARFGAASLSRVLWGAALRRTAVSAGTRLAVRHGAGAFRPRRIPLTAKTVINAGEWYISPEISASDMERLEQEHAPLTIIDAKGNKFEDTPYGIYEDIFAVQNCYGDEPLILFEKPNFNSREISDLNIGEEVGVLDRSFEKRTGWYRIQRTTREIGWTHGNCLVDLDSTKYYD